MRDPSVTPAGILTFSFSSFSVTPRPWHAGQGCDGIRPDPWQRSQRRPQTLFTELVVRLALRVVRQDVVGERDALELLFRLAVPGIDVGMVFPRELAVGLLDLVGGRTALDPEIGVKITCRHESSVPGR